MTPFYTPTGMTLDRSIGYFIRRIERLMTARAESLFVDTAISFTQWASLNLIRNDAATTCSALSRCLGHNTGATTRLIDQLEERGLLTRCREGDDRRVVRLALTAEGARMLATVTPRVVGLWNDVLGAFEHDEVEALLALLARLMRALERPDAPETQS